MVNVQEATVKIAELSLMTHFPQEDIARTALVRIICEMAENNPQIDWLVARVLSLFNTWPGVQKIRAVFCRRFKPKDGIEAGASIEEMERWAQIAEPQIPGITIPAVEQPQMKALPPGNVTADPTLQVAFDVLMITQKVKEHAWDSDVTEEEIASAPRWLRKLEGYED